MNQKAYEKSKNRMFKHMNIGSRNLDTHYTWDTVLAHMKNHFYNYTIKCLQVPLVDQIEMPNNDASYQRSTNTGRDLMERAKLPRGIIVTSFEVNRDQLQYVPTMNQIYRMNSDHFITVAKITAKDFRVTCPEYPINPYMDFNFKLIAHTALTNSTLFYTILLDSRPMTAEVAKQLRREFPDRDPRDFYYGVKYINEETRPYGRKINIPYHIRSIIPIETIHQMMDVLGMNKDDENNYLLILQVLRKYSNYKIDYTIDGGTRKRVFTFEYPSQITWVTESIDDGIVEQDNNIATYGVKIEGVVHYMEMPMFKLTTSYNMLNVDNPDNIADTSNYEDNVSYHNYFVSILSHDIKGTTIWDTYMLQYDESDLYKEKDKDGKVINKYMRIKMKNLTNDWRLNEYIDFILNSPIIFDREKYFNIEVRHTTMLKTWMNAPKVGNDYGIEIDYENKFIYDDLSEPHDSIYVAIYINKQRFHDWCIERGYSILGNLSDF